MKTETLVGIALVPLLGLALYANLQITKLKGRIEQEQELQLNTSAIELMYLRRVATDTAYDLETLKRRTTHLTKRVNYLEDPNTTKPTLHNK